MNQNTILIVDDDRHILNALERLLTDIGCIMFLADNGMKGLKIMNTEEIHLVISDHKMPGMDGITFLNEVKKISPKTIRIMLTGFADIELAIKAINDGEVYRFITKPWNNLELLSSVKQSLEYYNMQQELILLHNKIRSQNEELIEWNVKLEQKVAEQTNHIRNLFLDAIKSLVFALEAKDKYTEGHSRRVTEFATYICQKLSLSNDFIEDIKLGSLLHDIGKIGIKATLLNKKETLTNEELDIIKTHVSIGERILTPIIKNNTVIHIIRHHHERFDGMGYPDGLKKLNIPLEARIVAVADSYDALLSERPYREQTVSNRAKEELLKNANTQFDPKIVDVLITLR